MTSSIICHRNVVTIVVLRRTLSVCLSKMSYPQNFRAFNDRTMGRFGSNGVVVLIGFGSSKCRQLTADQQLIAEIVADAASNLKVISVIGHAVRAVVLTTLGFSRKGLATAVVFQTDKKPCRSDHDAQRCCVSLYLMCVKRLRMCSARVRVCSRSFVHSSIPSKTGL